MKLSSIHPTNRTTKEIFICRLVEWGGATFFKGGGCLTTELSSQSHFQISKGGVTLEAEEAGDTRRAVHGLVEKGEWGSGGWTCGLLALYAM